MNVITDLLANPEIAGALAGVVGGAVAWLVIFGITKLKALVIKTENKVDDAAILPIVDAVLTALETKKKD
jgi:hypothetical protein